VFLFAVAAVGAADNATCGDDLSHAQDTDAMEKTYFHNEETGEKILDDTVITHNVVKYYGDKTKFKVKVYDDDYNEESDVCVSFGKDWTHLKEKTTDGYGNVFFPINYKVGKHKVMTYIECDGSSSYYLAKNTVTIKSTIKAKTVTKYTTQKSKKFSVKFLNTKGKALASKKITFKIKGKTYKTWTDSKGMAKIKINDVKTGCHRIVAINPASKEKRTVYAYIFKKGEVKSAFVKIKKSNVFGNKRLKTRDMAQTAYEWRKNRQFDPGVYAWLTHPNGGLEAALHSKIVKAKFYFKDSYGKVVTKTSSYVAYDTIKVNDIHGFTPYKAKIWYRVK
jgi:hypothetical protein